MAGDWIKFEIATPDKPEVWQIAESLSIDPDAVVGKLLRVWSWFDQQTENGNAPSVSKLLLDRLVGVTGFCKVVIESGWMIDDGKILTLPHFDRHNGKTAKNRALTAKRVAQHKAKGNDTANDPVTQTPLPKEEKRREDIDNILPFVPSERDAVPIQEIVSLFNKCFPELPQVQKISDSRKKAVKQRWIQNTELQTLEKWERFFNYVKQSDFLMGRTSKPWSGMCFDWLMNPANFIKIYEGNYHGEQK